MDTEEGNGKNECVVSACSYYDNIQLCIRIFTSLCTWKWRAVLLEQYVGNPESSYYTLYEYLKQSPIPGEWPCPFAVPPMRQSKRIHSFPSGNVFCGHSSSRSVFRFSGMARRTRCRKRSLAELSLARFV